VQHAQSKQVALMVIKLRQRAAQFGVGIVAAAHMARAVHFRPPLPLSRIRTLAP